MPTPKSTKKDADRAAANEQDRHLLDINERILKDIYEVYAKVVPSKSGSSSPALETEGKVHAALLKPGEEGILEICKKLGMSCIAPRRKINVMIVGNHSAGKSSYINWYIGEHVQSTAVAIETQGFTFCTSGKKRDTLKGQATMQLFAHLQPLLQQFAPAIHNGLQTEISTSKERCFPLITFIDTPGLVDGSFQYLFPVEDAILAVAKHTDLIYIFFDPIGQALCDRTMKVIERLNLEHAEKLRYFLSKADTVPNERDRQKVVVQITQNLSSRVRNAHAFELPSLYIPDHSSGSCKIENILEKTCEEMQQTINQAVQNNLNKLEKDCLTINERIEKLLAADSTARAHNRKAALNGWLAFAVSLLSPLLVIIIVLHRSGLVASLLLGQTVPPALVVAHDLVAQTCDALVSPAMSPGSAADGAQTVVAGEPSLPVPTGTEALPTSGSGLLSMPQFLGGGLLFFVALQALSRRLRSYVPAYSKRELANLVGTQKYVTVDLLELKKGLYKEYLCELSTDPSGMMN